MILISNFQKGREWDDLQQQERTLQQEEPTQEQTPKKVLNSKQEAQQEKDSARNDWKSLMKEGPNFTKCLF